MRDRRLRVAYWLSAALAVLAHGGCSKQCPSEPGPFTTRLLMLSETAGRELDITIPSREQTLVRLGELARRVRQALRGQSSDRHVAALNALVFGAEGYRRVTDRERIDAMLLPLVLTKRRGSCLGLGGLYLALGEATGLALAGVLVPGHFFVRHVGGSGPRDIELLKRGRQMPTSWYRRKYRVPGGSDLYLRTLTGEESLEVLRFNLANTLRERGELAGAAGHYRQVVARLPLFAEAQANLGLTYQLMGQRRKAEAAYRAAKRANPHIEGLDQNLRRLED